MGPLDEFVARLLTERGVAPDHPLRGELAEELSERLEDFINRRVIDAMDGPTVERFTALLDTGPDAPAVQAFIERNVPNRQRVAASALTEFRNLYLGRTA